MIGVAVGIVTVAAALAARLPPAGGLLSDVGFERMRPGALEARRADIGWEVQRVGRDTIRDRLQVTCVADPGRPKSGRQCVSLSLPADTVGFEYVAVGQRVRLSAQRVYTASVWVRWPDGPERAPHGGVPSEGRTAAIVSFWVRHRDGDGAFAGKDVWLYDSRWTKLTFRFCADEPETRSLLYVSLLPNQKPIATTVLVDDLDLREERVSAAEAASDRELMEDGGFEGQQGARLGAPWAFVPMGPGAITHEVVREDGAFVRLSMPAATSNFGSAQVTQHARVRRGVRYEVSCRLRWDSYREGCPDAIVNLGVYDGASGTWYGPIDYTLPRSGAWHTARFAYTAPVNGTVRLYIQLNGWGNAGRALTLSADDVSFREAAPARPVSGPAPG